MVDVAPAARPVIDPTQPTVAVPGSPERIRVYRARARARLPLFHPGDAVGRARKRRRAGRNSVRQVEALLAALQAQPRERRVWLEGPLEVADN